MIKNSIVGKTNTVKSWVKDKNKQKIICEEFHINSNEFTVINYKKKVSQNNLLSSSASFKPNT